MLSYVIRSSRLRLIAKGPIRTSSVVITRSLTSFVDQFKGREAVEEGRFVRERDMEAVHKIEEQKHAELLAKNEDQAKLFHDEVIAPNIAFLEMLLSESGDKISPEGLEFLAKWKIGLIR